MSLRRDVVRLKGRLVRYGVPIDFAIWVRPAEGPLSPEGATAAELGDLGLRPPAPVNPSSQRGLVNAAFMPKHAPHAL